MDLRLAEPAMPPGGADGSDTPGRCPPGHRLGIHPEYQGDLSRGEQWLWVLHGHGVTSSFGSKQFLPAAPTRCHGAANQWPISTETVGSNRSRLALIRLPCRAGSWALWGRFA